MTDPVQDVIAAGVLITSVVTVLNNRRGKLNATKLDEVHTLVNQQLTDQTTRADDAQVRASVAEAATLAAKNDPRSPERRATD